MSGALRTVILGAGAVGGYIGARLIASGFNVTFIARGERLKQLSNEGLVVRSPLGDTVIPVDASDAADLGSAAQLVVLACKAPALNSAIAAVAPCVGQDTRILPVLNGVRHLATLQRAFPANPILGGIAHGALTLRSDGTIDHLSPFFTLIVGSASDASDPIAQHVVESLRASQMDARLSADIQQDLWSKFVFLTTLAGITCLMRASIGTIMATADGPGLIRQLFNECLSVAQRAGRAPDAQTMTSYMALLTQTGSSFTSSMLRDIESGRRTESEHILADMLERAKTCGLDTPVLSTCATHLACYEASLVC